MQVAQGPDRLAISRVNFYLTLAKAEKCRTPLELFFKIMVKGNIIVAYAAAMEYTVGVQEKHLSRLLHE